MTRKIILAFHYYLCQSIGMNKMCIRFHNASTITHFHQDLLSLQYTNNTGYFIENDGSLMLTITLNIQFYRHKL